MRIHGTADLYGVAGGATKVASLCNSAAEDTGYAGVVRSSYGAGQVVAFSYDLAESTVYLRQGNPDWANEEHSGSSGLKTVDLFYDQPSNTYWNGGPIRDGILQADEQMRLLTHAIEATSALQAPLPRLWYFPNAEKSVLVWTGDQDGGSISAIQTELNTVSAHGGHASIYILNPLLPLNGNYGPRGPMPSAANVADWTSAGHEISIHFDDTAERASPTWANMSSIYADQIADFNTYYPTAPTPKSLRNHYVVWVGQAADGSKEFAAQAQIEQSNGFELEFNYYNQRLPGQDTSGNTIPSGLPMRFTTSAGEVLDIFQADSQVTDEIGSDAVALYKNLVDASLDDGAYSWIVVNSHPVSWGNFHNSAGQILDYAVARGVPIWSGGEMNSFLQMRDAADFKDIQWNGSDLLFSVASPVAGYGALTVMLPTAFDGRLLTGIQVGGLNANYVVQTISGSDYALFTVGDGTSAVHALYAPEPTTGALLGSGLLALLVCAWRNQIAGSDP